MNTGEKQGLTLLLPRFTVLVDHSVLATSIKHLQGTSSQLDGRLYVKKSKRLCRDFSASTDMRGLYETTSPPCYIKPNETTRGLDYFSLDVLLAAAGASLDDVNYGGEQGGKRVIFSHLSRLVSRSGFTRFDSFLDERSSLVEFSKSGRFP